MAFSTTREKEKKYRTFYKFNARLYYDTASQNLFMEDINPRYYVKPVELLEIMEWHPSAHSLDWGFFRDLETNFYLKDLVMPHGQALIQYGAMSSTPPFGWTSEEQYSEYAKATFVTVQQGKWQDQYEEEVNAGNRVVESSTLSYVPLVVEYTEEKIGQVTFDAMLTPNCTADGLKLRSQQTLY